MADPAAPVLAVDIGGTKLAAGAGRRPTGDDRRPWVDARRRRARTPTSCSRRWCGSSATSAAAASDEHGLVAALRRRVRRTDDRRAARRSRRSTSPPGATSRLRARLAEPRSGCPTLRRQRRQGARARPRGGWVRPAGATNFLAMVVSTGVGGGIVLDGRLLDGAARQRRPHRPRHRRARRPAVPLRQPGLPRGRGVGHRHRRDHRPPTGRGRRRHDRAHRPRWSVAPSRSVAVLLDLPLAVVAGSVALGFGEPFFAAAQAEIDRRGPARLRPRAVASRPAGLGADGPLVGAAAVGLRRPPLSRRSPGRQYPRPSCNPPTRPRPRPTGRRSRRSSPSTCRPAGSGSARWPRPRPSSSPRDWRGHPARARPAGRVVARASTAAAG